MNDDIQLIEPDWPSPPGVQAAFTLRTGGVSPPPYDSLNIGAGIGDSSAAVAENRRRLRERLQLAVEPVWLDQVHGVDVLEFGGSGHLTLRAGAAARGNASTGAEVSAGANPSALADAFEQADTSARAGTSVRADACVAHVSGAVCAIRVADCMPVLFAAEDGSAVGAAHAGWRGLAGGVLEATVARLGALPWRLLAWMGPTIGPRHFEVGEDVRSAFTNNNAGAGAAFQRNDRGRWQCDLYALARQRLERLGITRIYGGGWCTFAEADRFFSYRRDGQCGRMAALIWIK